MTWAELLTIQLAYHSIPFTGKLVFSKEFWMDEKSAKECGASELFTHVRNRSHSQMPPNHVMVNEFLFRSVVRPNHSTAGTFVATQRRILAAEGTDFVELREDFGQPNGAVQIPRHNSHFTKRMCLLAEVFVHPSPRREKTVHPVIWIFIFLFHRQNGAVSQQQYLLLLLPSIRQAEQIIRKFWIDVYRNGNVNMKKLFVEMLESVSK